jgi:hypothetical protein
LLRGNGSWREAATVVAARKRFLERDCNGSYYAETVLGERLQVLQQNVNCLLEEYNQNGSWKEAAGFATERRVTDRQIGLSEFIYKICCYGLLSHFVTI